MRGGRGSREGEMVGGEGMGVWWGEREKGGGWGVGGLCVWGGGLRERGREATASASAVLAQQQQQQQQQQQPEQQLLLPQLL